MWHFLNKLFTVPGDVGVEKVVFEIQTRRRKSWQAI